MISDAGRMRPKGWMYQMLENVCPFKCGFVRRVGVIEMWMVCFSGLRRYCHFV